MRQNFSFWRKVGYIGVIVLLLFPLFWIGQPATRTATGSNPGGVLARLRAENNLSQAELGEIDPAGESFKLATLGLRGVAANLLWEKSFEYKKREDWDGLSATLNQITKLQPNFITVWEHQSHNLSYNVSMEFDDYRMRYHWVKKGVDFLVEGIRKNRENPRLLHYTGWIIGQKIGRADEHVQFRELFRRDEDFHNSLNADVPIDKAHGWDGRPDNWLVSQLWYQRAERAVDAGIPLKGKSPLIFYASDPMSLINYASTIEEEGVLGDTAQQAWYEADQGWSQYGRRAIPTSWGHNIRLGEYEQVNDDIKRMEKRLAELAPGVAAQIRQEKIAALDPALRAALDLSEAQLTDENYAQHYDAQKRTEVTHREVAERAPSENRAAALSLAERLSTQELMSSRISHYRGIVNYEYWALRCQAEQTKTAVDARESLYKAQQAHDAADLETARSLYEQSWRLWRQTYDKFPGLMDDLTADDLTNGIKRYQRLLQQLDEQIPADFPLGDLLQKSVDRDEGIKEMYRQFNEASRAAERSKDEPTAKPTDQPPTKPEATKPEAAKPDAAKPEDVQPDAAKPEAAEPEAAEPDAAARMPDTPAETASSADAKAESEKPKSEPADTKIEPEAAKAKPDSAEPKPAEPKPDEPKPAEPQN